MTIQEVVRIVSSLLLDEGESLRARYGPEAVTYAQNMQHLLATRLQEESAYASLWNAFSTSPQTEKAELIGALEALVESDPALARRLSTFVREYHKVLAPPGAERAKAGDKTSDDTRVRQGINYLYGIEHT